MFEEKFGSPTSKTFNRSTKKTAVLGMSHIIRKVGYCITIREAWVVGISVCSERYGEERVCGMRRRRRRRQQQQQQHITTTK